MNRKKIRWAIWTVASPFILFILLAIFIYLPPIQNFLVDKAAQYASQSLGMQIKVGRIALSFPLNLVVTEVEAFSEEADTLLQLKRFQANIELLPLLKKRVEIEEISLNGVKANSANFIPGMQISGEIGELFLLSRGVLLEKEEATINKLLLKDSKISLCLNDSTPADTTKSDTVFWKLFLNNIELDNVAFAMQMPQDSLSLNSYLGKAELKGGLVDLHQAAYSLQSFLIKDGEVKMDQGELPKADPIDKQLKFDPSHLHIKQIQVQLDSLYYKERDIHATILNLSMREQSGIELASTKGKINSNEKVIRLSALKVETPSSYLEADASIDWEVLEGGKEGWITARIMADIAKPDASLFMRGIMEDEFIQQYPSEPFRLRAGIDGTLTKLKLTNLQATMPTAFNLSMKGELVHLTDSTLRGGAIKLEAETEDLHFIESLVTGVKIPSGNRLNGNFSIKGNQLLTDLILAQPHTNTHNALDTLLIYAGNDSLSLKDEFKLKHAARLIAGYNLASTAYQVEMAVNKFDLNQYLPNDSLYTLSLHLEAKGSGFDPLSPATKLEAYAVMDEFRYASYNFSGVQLSVAKEKEKITTRLTAKNRELDVTANIDATLNQKHLAAQLLLDAKMIDWDALRLSQVNLNTAHLLKLEVESDLKNSLSVKTALLNNRFTTDKQTVTSKDLYARFHTQNDSVIAYMQSGDLELKFKALGGIDPFIAQLNRFTTKATEQWKLKQINQELLKELYPTMEFKLRSGKQNPIYNILSANQLAYDNLQVHLGTSPANGLKGNLTVKGFHTDSLTLDTISMNITQEGKVIRLASNVISESNPKQEGFEIKLDGELDANQFKILLQQLNARKEKGVYLGVDVLLEKEGIRVGLFPEEPTIVYRPFNLNQDNYLFLSNKGWMEGNIQMYDEKGSGLHLFTSQEDSTALHDLSLGLYKIDLKEFRRIIPYMPNIEGILGVNAHYVETEGNQTLSADIQVDQFKYENSNLGNWELSAVYLPREGKGHSIDGYIIHDEVEVAKWGGIYLPEKGEKGGIHAGIKLQKFPMNIANPFIPDQLAELSGSLNGTLTAKGDPLKPILNGDLALDSASIYMPDYSANFRFDNRPIKMDNSKLVFDQFSIFTKGENPFTIDGTVDLTNVEQVKVDLNLNAANYELLNAPKTKRAMVFGKVYVDIHTTIRGTVEELVMRGNMNLLGKTNITYVMKDAPLTVNDRLNDLVEFVNFNDTISYEKEGLNIVSINGMDIAMTINIDQMAQVQVSLTPDGSNYVSLEGGGNLSFQYTPRGEMLLYGRYSLISGDMKYQIPVIPLKSFKVLNGSFVEWTGNPMNPTMNITATESVRASVAEEGKPSRMVSFNTGVHISQQLENPGLNFVLSTPEDAVLQDKLNSLSAEERGKMAVTMLVTGMYIGDGGGSSGSFNTNSALNSFLQSEISNIAGKVLDINLGMETVGDEASGGKRTDYNFQFAKRFWNNRFRIVIGGTVSTGGENANQGNSFIDNIAIEYRLDQSGMRNVKLFHSKNYESILEGEIIETGVGLVLHRKMSKLNELFIFKQKKK
ncbi:MAG: translocation/assembly module TamB domain-containing protein [Phocaeicola sp.]